MADQRAYILTKDREAPVNLADNGDFSVSNCSQLYQGEPLRVITNIASLKENQSRYFEQFLPRTKSPFY